MLNKHSKVPSFQSSNLEYLKNRPKVQSYPATQPRNFCQYLINLLVSGKSDDQTVKWSPSEHETLLQLLSDTFLMGFESKPLSFGVPFYTSEPKIRLVTLFSPICIENENDTKVFYLLSASKGKVSFSQTNTLSHL